MAPRGFWANQNNFVLNLIQSIFTYKWIKQVVNETEFQLQNCESQTQKERAFIVRTKYIDIHVLFNMHN